MTTMFTVQRKYGPQPHSELNHFIKLPLYFYLHHYGRGTVFTATGLSVCLLAGLLRKLWADFNKLRKQGI